MKNMSCQLCPSSLLARRHVRRALRALARDPSVSFWARERVRARLPLNTPAAAAAMLMELDALLRSVWLGPLAAAAVEAAATAVRAALADNSFGAGV